MAYLLATAGWALVFLLLLKVSLFDSTIASPLIRVAEGFFYLPMIIFIVGTIQSFYVRRPTRFFMAGVVGVWTKIWQWACLLSMGFIFILMAFKKSPFIDPWNFFSDDVFRQKFLMQSENLWIYGTGVTVVTFVFFLTLWKIFMNLGILSRNKSQRLGLLLCVIGFLVGTGANVVIFSDIFTGYSLRL